MSDWNGNDNAVDWEDDLFDEFVHQEDCVEELDELPAEVPGRLMVALSALPGSGGAPSQPTIVAADAPSSCQDSGELRPPSPESIECRELAEAYLDDAARCMAGLDQAVIEYESNSDRENAVRQILRELHTLKGASAAVGLMALSGYIHQVEEVLQHSDASPETMTKVMLECLASLREQSAKLNAGSSETAEDKSLSTPSAPIADGSAESIRVSGAQMDRLLDMVTSLTMLNNQRDTYVDQLRNLNAHVSHCSSRIRDLERSLNQSASNFSPNRIASVNKSMREVGNDLEEIGTLLRSAYFPIANEHVAVSNFTQQFRHALVSILRMPVSGLFRRLQRAALDAARVEGKQVRLAIVGSESGLERPIQERLLDPLMHIVRNAVSHGIEFPEERVKSGKDPVGVITLEASSSPNLLTLNVRDDGRGLNYDALRKRGMQLGLITDSYQASEKELGQLIFHPGFSTRDESNEVAGRGIGMDVVADVLEKMRAWIDVESVPGKGLTVKLSVPLKSITEHALVFRVAQHLVALPMQYVRSQPNGTVSLTHLADVLGVTSGTTPTAALHLAWTSNQLGRGVGGDTTSLLVDEILGTQEVVVRPLPSILRNHPFLSGVTISTSGKVVYMLEPRAIAAAANGGSLRRSPEEPATPGKKKTARILVVDDSLSARRAVSHCCENRDWEIVEAQDGVAGLEMLDQGDWTAIVTDYDMPGMDGIQFIEAVRQRVAFCRVPILMASSRSAEEMRTKALGAGASRYATKPVTTNILDELVSLHPSN